MNERRQIEREFGVPLAGEILPDRALWSQTALKRLPPPGPLDWQAIFGRRAPLILDVGCGNGRYAITSAFWRPDHDHLGIDFLPLVLRYASRRGNQRGLKNLRFAAIDGYSLLSQYVAPRSIREIHCYHPQPYYHPADAGKRLINPAFLALVHQSLEPGGLFFVQTDNPPYWNYIRQIAPHFFEFHDQPQPWPDSPRGRTRREIIALKRGLFVQRGWGSKREGLDANTLAKTLPGPDFDAGPRPVEVDNLE